MLKLEKCVQEELFRVYANDTELRGDCLTILAKNQIFLNEVKWDDFKSKAVRLCFIYLVSRGHS